MSSLNKNNLIIDVNSNIYTNSQKLIKGNTLKNRLLNFIDSFLINIKDTSTNFTNNNPILKIGEIGIESDSLTTAPRFKIGDGITPWNSLPYGATTSQTLSQVLANGAATGEQAILSDNGASIVEIYNSYTQIQKGFLNGNNKVRVDDSAAWLISTNNIDSTTASVYADAFNGNGMSSVVANTFYAPTNDFTGDLNILSGKTDARFRDAYIWLRNGATTKGEIYLTGTEADIYNAIGGFYAAEGIPFGTNKYFQVKSTDNEIKHTTQNSFISPINYFFGDIILDGAYSFDVKATAGSDVLNIGATNADVINIGRAGATVNFLGTALYEYAANQYVLDKLITLNYNGAAASGIGVGFEIEEGGSITGYLKTNADRTGFSLLSPANTFYTDFVFSSTSARTKTFQDTSSTIAEYANKLSVFASTTSAELAGVISDETGSGALVFANAPTLVNPIVGTQSPGDNSTKAASTAYVDAANSLDLKAANNLSDVSNPLTSRNNLNIWDLFMTTGDQSTTSDVASNITDLVSVTLTSNKRYRIEGGIHLGCNNTGGVKLAFTVPTGATMFISSLGRLNASNALNVFPVTSSGTLTAAFNTLNNSSGYIYIMGEISLSSTSGVFQVQFASGVNTQTSTIYQSGTQLTLTQIN